MDVNEKIVYILVSVKHEKRCVQQESYPLARKKEQNSKEGMGDIFREDELVELIAEIYGVDVVALEVREHDDLQAKSGT